MSNRIIVRSNTDNHILLYSYKAYYNNISNEKQKFLEHRHTELEISAIISGFGTYTCGNINYDFSPGDIFLHRGNDNHYFSKICSGQQLALIALRFDPRFIWSSGGQWFDSSYLKIFMTPDHISRCIPHNAQVTNNIYQLLEEIFQECRLKEAAYELLVKAKLLTILANAARYFHNDLNNQEPLTNLSHLPQMEQSMNYILSHLSDPLTLDLLAKEVAMSRSKYSTLFKSLNGVSVWEYVTNQRINLAQYQLEHYNIPITQICENCGFNNIANFNRTFKKITGKTPREYKYFIKNHVHDLI